MSALVFRVFKRILATILFLSLSCTFLLAQCDSVLTLGNDTIICELENVVLDASLTCALSYEWQDGSTSSNYVVTESGTYSCNVVIQGDNMVQNGDFESGNTLFTTAYLLGSGGPWGNLSNEGTYAIATDPNDTHINFSSCGDHTSGNGNMMVVNGSTIQNTTVWSQMINVEENTDYRMATWLISCVSDNPGTLRFTINGSNIGSSFTSPSTTCSWTEFSEEWNSGTNTSVTFSIVSQGGFAGGNDYALDDITFFKVEEVTDTIVVEVEELFAFDLGPDTILCEGQVLTLDAFVPDAEYVWQNNATFSSFDVIGPGLYWVNVSHGVCFQSDSIDVAYAIIPDDFLGEDANLCLVDSLFLAIDIDDAEYLWQDSSTQATYTITEEGIYWLDITLEHCTKRDSLVINSVSISLGPDTSLCIGESLLLDVSNQGSSFIWQDQSTGPTYLVNEAGTYSVEIESGSCLLYGEINVNYFDPPLISLGNDTNLCVGDFLILDPGIQNASYLWQDASVTSTFTVSTEGWYWLQIVENNCAYTDIDSIYINYDPVPYVYLGKDTALCAGTELILGTDFIGTGIQYEWQNASNEPVIIIEEEGLYWLEMSTACGSDADSIKVEYFDCDCPYFIPNSFSPNGDMKNDLFPPVYECNFLEFSFIIFNRWGEVVFETNDPYEQWDGNFKGKPAPMDVYPYQFQFLQFNEYRTERGFVNLIR
jgi:gliding motility-associated-like protein